MNCYIEKSENTVLVTSQADHGLNSGDTIRITVTRPARKVPEDRIKATFEMISSGAGKLITSGHKPTVRAKVKNVIAPRVFTVESSEVLSPADLQEAATDPCQDMNGVDPIYWLTCCVMGLGCNDN